MILVFLLLVPVIVDIVRRPTFRNLAFRNVSRRRGEAALVIIGSLLGTAIICASGVVGDTVDASIRDAARTNLGPIDETVRLVGPQQFDQAETAITNPPIAGVDGMLRVYSAGAVIANTATDRKAQPSAAMVEIDFDQARALGPDPAITGLSQAGATPTGDEVVIGSRLATKLGVQAGDHLELFAYGSSKVFTVRGVITEIGLAGYAPVRSSRFTSGQPVAVFVPPGTITAMVANAPTAASNAQTPTAEILVSNTGGIFDGADGTKAVADELKNRTANVTGVQIGKLKTELLDQAKTQGDSLATLFRSIGFFSVIAGILLLVNLFVMLSEERKTELGMLRALGFKRNHLVRTFAIEGATYSFIASVLGAVAGIGVGWAIIQATTSIFNRGNSDLTFTLTVKPASLISGASIGLVISMATVWGTSFRISRLNIIRSIRDLPEPKHLHQSLGGVIGGGAAAVVFGLLFALGMSRDNALLILGAPAAALFGLIFVVARFLPRKPVTVGLSLLALGWGIGVFTALPGKVGRAGIDVFVVQGIVLVAAGVTIFAQADRVWAAAAKAASASGRGLSARLGLAYPLARKFRTALLLAMYSIVIFTMAFISVLSGIFANQAPAFTDEARAGFDLFVESSQGNPVSVDQLKALPNVVAVAPLTRGAALAITPKRPDGLNAALTGFDQSLLDQGQPKLENRDASYATDAAAFAAVLRDPGLIIVNQNFGAQGGGGPPQANLVVGDTVKVRNTATNVEKPLKVVGIMSSDFVNNGGMVSNPFLDDFLGPRKVQNRHYVKVTPGADASTVSASISGALIQNGADAHSFRSVVDENLQAQIAFFGLLRAYLGLGLLIGIAGLGVVMVRAVRERRREIGMLRAMGFSSGVVRRAFILEAAFIALQGILLGVGLGMITSYNLLVNSDAFGDQKFDFSWPWGVLATIAIVPLAASLLATAWPATQASRIRPAVALRIAD
jgi:putative ABC transport system permease protein